MYDDDRSAEEMPEPIGERVARVETKVDALKSRMEAADQAARESRHGVNNSLQIIQGELTSLKNLVMNRDSGRQDDGDEGITFRASINTLKSIWPWLLAAGAAIGAYMSAMVSVKPPGH